MNTTADTTSAASKETQAAVSEQWTEIRCIACVPLGWYASHLLLRMHSVGKVGTQDVRLQLKCPRCKSLVEWRLGTPEFVIITEGVRNHKRQLAAFE